MNIDYRPHFDTKRYRLLTAGREGDPSGMISVRCRITRRCVRWNQAAAEGWRCDMESLAFSHYYSPEAFHQL